MSHGACNITEFVSNVYPLWEMMSIRPKSINHVDFLDIQLYLCTTASESAYEFVCMCVWCVFIYSYIHYYIISTITHIFNGEYYIYIHLYTQKCVHEQTYITIDMCVCVGEIYLRSRLSLSIYLENSFVIWVEFYIFSEPKFKKWKLYISFT